MNIDIQCRPGAAVAKINFDSSEGVMAEGGAMIATSPNVTIETSMFKKEQGGLLSAAKRLLSGENLFLNKYSTSGNGEVWLAPSLPGDLMVYELNNETIYVQGGSYMASSGDIKLDLSFQGAKSFLSGESLFWVKLSGTGKVIFNSYGMIYPIEIEDSYIVDTGHIVGFTESLKFTISKAGKSWISSFLGGEGLVCKFEGKGTLWFQSHNPSSFGSMLGPLLRPRK
jgi:uncharacterized protein (TIGR00266 family)